MMQLCGYFYLLTVSNFRRLKLLRGIEQLKIKNVEGNAFKLEMDTLVNKHMPLSQGKDAAITVARGRRDFMSHFILRLAFCRTEELRRWFIQHEVFLFRHRLESAPPSDFEHFLKSNDLRFEVVSEAERLALAAQLSLIERRTATAPSDNESTSGTYFK